MALLPRGAVLVNVSRGGLVDEDALYDALASGHCSRPVWTCSAPSLILTYAFASWPNVIMSPHIGSGSVETRNAMGFRALDNIAAVLAGRGAIDPLWR